MSAEDAFVLSTLLSKVSKRAEIPAALQAYDEVRRPRCQAVIDSSYDAGLLMTGVKPEVGLDVEKLRAELKHKWDHILPYDVVAAKPKALETMAEILSRQA